MIFYRYYAKDKKGRKYKGVQEAENEAALVKALLADGLYCYRVKDVDQLMSAGGFTVPLKLLSPLCSQFSSMLSAGVPLAEILRTSRAVAVSYEMKGVLAELEEKVHRGHTLSEAMESMNGCFPKLLVYMIQTGETSGKLDEILAKMSVYYAKEVEMRRKVRTAMIYPCILLTASIVISVFLLTVVLPQFTGMLADYELPAITRFMLSAGDRLKQDWMAWCLWFPVLFLAVAAFLTVSPLRLRADWFIAHIPGVSKLLRTVYTSRFASAFSVLYGSGTGILECMTITGRVMGNTWVEKKVKEAGRNLEKGEGLSGALRRQHMFQPAFLAMVAAGEESGRLEMVLKQAGTYYEKEAEQSIERMITLLEPCMILIMAGIVGSIVLAIMLPVFGMYGTMI